jgi:hypothetical protein
MNNAWELSQPAQEKNTLIMVIIFFRCGNISQKPILGKKYVLYKYYYTSSQNINQTPTSS